MQNLSDAQVDVIESPMPESDADLLFADNWYKNNPDKILGVPYQTSGRFGNVTKYSGTIEVISRIEVDLDFLGATKSLNNPMLSVNNDINVSAEIQKPEVADIVRAAIRESDKEIKTIKSTKVKVVVDDAVVRPVAELNSFEQVFATLNPEISTEEVEVHTWYKTQIGKPLSRYYVRLFEPDMFEGDTERQLRRTYKYTVSQEKVNSWVAKGLLFYFEGKLYPKYEYQSGNMYDKKIRLESEKETIISKYGQEVYDLHRSALEEAYNVVYNKRLEIGGSNGLVVLASSKFANEFYVERIELLGSEEEGKKFKIKKITAKSKKDFGEPDFLGDLKVYTDWKRDEFEKLTLPDAFCYWMFKTTPPLKEAISHLDIYNYYILGKKPSISDKLPPEEKKKAEAEREKIKSATQKEGERLFAEFLETQLLPNDKVRLQTQWNSTFNNYLPINLNKIPVAFTMAKYVYGDLEEVRPEKRDAVAFTMSNGTGVLSYDVGVGKTPSAIFTISAFLDAGYCKRPLIVVPNQVYRQFIADFKAFAPHIAINEAYNLSSEYIENFKDADGEVTKTEEGTVTVMTYEGFENICFTDETRVSLLDGLYEILNQGGEDEKPKSKRQTASFRERIETMIGKGVKGGMYEIERFGFDFMCYDEAHKMKKVFTSVKGESEENEAGISKRGKNPYVISSGSPSSIGLRGFMVNYYILQQNDYKNILLLTATPFTNSPLEIFSMLSMVAYEALRGSSLDNLKAFFDTYVKTSTELVINTKLRPEFKQVILGFNNLISLQSLIRRFILYKTGEEVGVIRPQKYVLPYQKELVNEVYVDLPEDRKVETYLSMTPQQKSMMEDIIAYVEGGGKIGASSSDDDDDDEDEEGGAEGDINVGDIVYFLTGEKTEKGNPKKVKVFVEEIKDDKYSIVKVDKDEIPLEGKKANLGFVTADKIQPIVDTSFGVEVDEDSLGSDEKRGVRTIKGLSYSRNLALSPFLYKFSGLGRPDYLKYVNSSPKLKYVMDCIKSVRDYCISKGNPVAGQVIYMDRGIQFFKLLKEYLVKEVGYKEDEVGIIVSGLPKTGIRSKDYVKNLFNGEIYNEKTKTFDEVDDYKRIKVVIGSSTIKEGMNLQKYGAVLYNCFIDWNPTDIQQLEGRIYRQKNTYAAVRIVNPLVVDSADIFLFQKLMEKTSRLNTIWSSDGKTNVLNTEEFNPDELKYALIRDPKIIAELKIIEEKSKIDSEIIAIRRQESYLKQIREASSTINYYYDKIVEDIEDYREFTPTGELMQDAEKLVKLVNDAFQKQTDKEGRKIYGWYERRNLKPEEAEKASPLSTFQKPYYFSDFSLAVRTLNKLKRDFLDAYKIPFNLQQYDESLSLVEKDIKANIEGLEKQKESFSDKKVIDQFIEEAIAEKERQKIQYKSLPALVSDFGKMNYLLEQRVEGNKKKEVSGSTCPPVRKDDGKLDISADAIKKMDVCLAKEPQTKLLHFDSETGYTPERRKIHQKIINELFENVRCVKSDKQPIAIFTGGSPASGKSTFLKKNANYLLSDTIFKLDADAIREKLPEYKGWNANSTHLETGDIVNEILERIGSQSCRYDFIYDGTMNKAKKYFPLIKKVKELGYKVYIIFMDIPYGEAKKRALQRYQDSGRYVPMEVIDDFFTEINGQTKGMAALNELKPLVDGFVVADGITGNIKEEGGEGIPEKREPVYTRKPVDFKIDANVIGKPKPVEKTEPKKEDIRATINALKYLAQAGNKDAEATVKALSYLL